MNEKIFTLATQLNESLVHNPLVMELDELEKELNDSYEVYLLAQKKDECLETYCKLKDIYNEDNVEVMNALCKLKTAKENLSNHPLVRSYMSIYREVRDLYLQIDNILFSDLKGKSC